MGKGQGGYERECGLAERPSFVCVRTWLTSRPQARHDPTTFRRRSRIWHDRPSVPILSVIRQRWLGISSCHGASTADAARPSRRCHAVGVFVGESVCSSVSSERQDVAIKRDKERTERASSTVVCTNRYLPVVATGLQAAATSVRSAGIPPGQQRPHSPRMDMPVPQPTPHSPSVEGFHVPTGYAGVGASPSSLGRNAPSSLAAGGGGAVSGFSTSRSNSGESIHRTTAAARTASGSNSSRSSWGVGSGFEEIRKEEDVIAGGSQVENGRASNVRREGSWFGWSSPGHANDKAE